MNEINELNDELIDDLFELDTSWVDEFDKNDNEYKSYYNEELTFINLHCIYINKNSEISKVHEEKILFKTPGTLSREEVIGLIKRNTFCDNMKYSLLSILKFNINIEPINLKTFIKTKETSLNIGNHFLHSITNIDSICFDKSIGMFHDINDLLIIYYDKNNNNNNTNNNTNNGNDNNTNNTNNNSSNNSKNNTRKIYINSNSLKKTRRNLFKDITS
jgi:hypothetical protein